MNVLDRKTQRLILNLICRDNCIADIVDVSGCSPNTVRSYLARFGEALCASHDRLVRGVSPARIQADELWSYVYVKRERNLKKRERNAQALGPRKRQPPPERGAYYTWTAFDPDAKLLLAYHTGDRGYATGFAFMTDLRSRVEGRPLITTDAYQAYPDLIQRTFGSDMDHVVLHKVLKPWWNPKTGEKGNRLVGLRKEAQNQSAANIALASTSQVERMNGTIRNFNARFTRQTYKFSKRLANHLHALSIGVMYYNFVKAHAGFSGADRHLTPAMKAGITPKVWTYDNLLDEVDAYWARKTLRAPLTLVLPPQYVPLPVGQTSPLPYFVMYSEGKREAKVHKGSCRNCQHGVGRKAGGAGRNKWYAFATEAEALRCAQQMAPLEYSVCSICVVGKYSGNTVRRGTELTKSRKLK